MKTHRTILRVITLATLFVASPALGRAQVPVIDVANIIETTQIAYNTYESWRQLVQQYELLVRMARRAAGMTRYRTPDVPVAFHNPGRYLSGVPLIRALNGGDPSGQAYDSVTRTALRPESALAAMPAAARRNVEREYATIDIADSTGSLAGHQIGHVRSYTAATTAAIRALENDTLGGSDDEHHQTAILDRINAAEIIARRQDTAANQLISHLVEQSLVANKRQRDTEAVAMSMRVSRQRYYRDYSASFFPPSARAAASAWRQP